MSLRLSSCLEGRDNNFKLLRFGAAAAVFVSHCPGIADLDVISITTLLGYVAVNVFFLISGFLVASSLHVRKSILKFGLSRVLRVYPALILAVLYSVFILGMNLGSLTISDYIVDPLTLDYAFKNMLQWLRPVPLLLPGLDWDPVNAPLWTLPYELDMYLLLGLIGWLAIAFKGRFARPVWVVYGVMVLLASALYFADYSFNFDGYGLGSDRNYLRFLSMFGIGVLMFILRDRIVLKGHYILVIVALIVLSSPLRIAFVTLAYGTLGYVLLYLAYIPGGLLRQFNRLGDYSYGVYIFGYPTQKAVMAWWPAINVIELFLISFSITLLISMASWHLLERPALHLKRRFS